MIRTRFTVPTGPGMFRPAADDGHRTGDPVCANCSPRTQCDHKHRSQHTLITRSGTNYVGGCRSTKCGCRRFALIVAEEIQ